MRDLNLKRMPPLPDHWVPLENPWVTPEGRWESKVQFGPASEWFLGHFENYPVLPGVALLALVSETLRRQALNGGRVLEVVGFSRVRFRHLVLPGEELRISVAAMPGGTEAKLDFRVTSQATLVVQGFLKAREETRTEA